VRRQRGLPGFRNHANPAHVRELAELWNVDPDSLPRDGPPTHAMEIFRLAEEGDIRFLWISATNPAVSRPCDYTGLPWERLAAGEELQWPGGLERLYADGASFADSAYCESWGKDLATGEPDDEDTYRALNPDGRAVFRATAYVPPEEPVDAEYPLQLDTGRSVYHFHTRTKTGRAPELAAAAPEVRAELSREDAGALGVAEGDLVDVVSRRGRVRAPARLTGIRRGVVFVPFHYGYWDAPDGAPRRAANELTPTAIDPCSKQPIYKTSACRVQRVPR
jgi:anaerobic selenocysteine-containing dehydrogenase